MLWRPCQGSLRDMRCGTRTGARIRAGNGTADAVTRSTQYAVRGNTIHLRRRISMRLKTDDLCYRVYAKHGDMCGLAPNCKSLGCASGHDTDDYVLSAQFAYFQEAIDYAQSCAKRGVRMRLISRVKGMTPQTSDYTPAEKQHLATGSTFVVWANGSTGFLAAGHAPLP